MRESQVQDGLPLRQAIDGLFDALKGSAQEELISQPRVRIVPKGHDLAWLHTLRAGVTSWGVVGGKDYTSIGFETPCLFVTLLSLRTGRPIALIEAEHLTRLRTAAVTAVATRLLAPPEPLTLAHFGVGKISEPLVRAMIEVRPSLRRVLLVRRQQSAPPPDWLRTLPPNVVEARLVTAAEALAEADLATTATNSKAPVIPAGARLPRLKHLNLVGSNHPKRREIELDLARRCLPPRGLLVADDPAQAASEAGDFMSPSLRVQWKAVPSLAQLVRDPGIGARRDEVELTAFKSVGIGLMDLLVGAVLLKRLGLLPEPHGVKA